MTVPKDTWPSPSPAMLQPRAARAQVISDPATSCAIVTSRVLAELERGAGRSAFEVR